MGDGGAVEGEGEGAADAGVVQRGVPGVEAKEVGVDVIVDPQAGRLVPTVGGDLGEGEAVGHVELSGAKGALLGIDAVGRVEVDGVQADVRPVPVGGGFLDDDALLRGPLLQHKGTAGDEAAGAGPRRAAAVGVADGGDAAHVHRAPGDVKQDLEKIRRGMRECDDEGAGIRGGEADQGKILNAPLVEILRPADDVEQVGVVGGQGWREDPAPGIEAVLRSDLVTVGPLGRA